MKINDLILETINEIIDNGNTIIIFGLPDISESIYKKIKNKRSVKIINSESITSFSLKNISTPQEYDYIFLPNIPQKFTDHYTTWKEISNIAKKVVAIAPDMTFLFNQYIESIKNDIENNNLCFKTIKLLGKLYGNETETILSFYNKSNRIFYSRNIFENKNPEFLLNFLPYTSQISHEIITVNDIDYIKFSGNLHNESRIPMDILDIYKKYAEYFFNDPNKLYLYFDRNTLNENCDIIKIIEKFISRENIIINDRKENNELVEFVNLFQNINIRSVDILIDNLMKNKGNLTYIFQNLNKNYFIKKLEESIIDNDILEFWKLNCDIFKSPSHVGENLLTLFFTQNNPNNKKYLSVTSDENIISLKI